MDSRSDADATEAVVAAPGLSDEQGKAEGRKSVYRKFMSKAVRELFDETSADPEMGEEVQLIRTVMASQTGDMKGNSKKISDYLVTFLRLVGQHHKQREGPGDLASLLAELGEVELQRKQAEGPRPKQGSLFEPAGDDGPDEMIGGPAGAAGPAPTGFEEADADEMPGGWAGAAGPAPTGFEEGDANEDS